MTEPARKVLPPCKVTGKPCRWLSEEWYDEHGNMESWDNYCEDCFQWRDWSCDETDDDDER